MPTQPLQLLAAQAKFRLDKKVAERLAELDRIHQLGMARLGDLTTSDLRGVWEALQRKAVDSLKRAKTVDDLAESCEPSKQAVQSAAADARRSLKNSLREISREAYELAVPEVKRFAVAALNHVNGLEDNERELCASFGIPFAPSPLIVALKNEVARVQSGTERPFLGQIFRPASLIESFSPLN